MKEAKTTIDDSRALQGAGTAGSTEVQTAQTGGAVAGAAAAPAINFDEDAGGGTENIRGKDMAIPFLAVLQKGSPQVDKLSPKYIEGAEAGMIFNTVTGEIWPWIYTIPCGFNKELIEWKPRDSGGGFVARHVENDPMLKKCAPDERGRLVAPNGNVIIDTAYHFVLNLKAGSRITVLVKDRDGNMVEVSMDGFEWAIVGMQSTQLKKSRQWNTTMKTTLLPSGKIYPSFSHVYKLGSQGESKDKYTWFGWTVEQIGCVQDANLYNLAKDFAKSISEGSVQVSAPPAEAGAESTEEVPF